jgi:hypothetical protein
MWTAVGGLGGSLTAVGALTTFSAGNLGLSLPLLAAGLAILTVWYLKYFRD